MQKQTAHSSQQHLTSTSSKYFFGRRWPLGCLLCHFAFCIFLALVVAKLQWSLNLAHSIRLKILERTVAYSYGSMVPQRQQSEWKHVLWSSTWQSKFYKIQSKYIYIKMFHLSDMFTAIIKQTPSSLHLINACGQLSIICCFACSRKLVRSPIYY